MNGGTWGYALTQKQAGLGISVMKPFAGGQLLDALQSPFCRALTRVQCIQYALDRPGVLTVLPGVRGLGDLEILAYVDATPEERDYSVLADMAPESRAVSCMYCNHCQPCPGGIQIGTVNKYYDLACLGDKRPPLQPRLAVRLAATRQDHARRGDRAVDGLDIVAVGQRAMESLMGLIKAECVHAHTFETRERAALEIFDYIEAFYNRARIRSTLGDLSPEEFEARHMEEATAAA